MSGATIIVQARTTSRRFPGKVVEDLCGAPMLVRLVERLQRTGLPVVVATSTEPSDDIVAEVASEAGTHVFRGSLDDVLGRYVGAASAHDADPVIRVTADCPLIDPEVLREVLDVYERGLSGGSVWASNTLPRSFPDGLDTEIFGSVTLERLASETDDPYEREHVTLHLYRHVDRFPHAALVADRDYSTERWTVDFPEDLRFVRAVYGALYPVSGAAFGWRDVLRLLETRPEVAALQRA